MVIRHHPIEAASLEDGDIVKVLMDQHEQIKNLLHQVADGAPEAREEPFSTLRALLAVHETAEEVVLRPVTSKVGDKGVADERNSEEAEAAQVLVRLESLDPASTDFIETFASFAADVIEHAQKEEQEEFPAILAEIGPEQRGSMGRSVHSVESMAPTHPHTSAAGSPAAQWALGPFAAMVDRVRDALSK